MSSSQEMQAQVGTPCHAAALHSCILLLTWLLQQRHAGRCSARSKEDTFERFQFFSLAAAGKSFLLKRLISFLKAKHGASVFVTAATGIAATHIGGKCSAIIHTFIRPFVPPCLLSSHTWGCCPILGRAPSHIL